MGTTRGSVQRWAVGCLIAVLSACGSSASKSNAIHLESSQQAVNPGVTLTVSSGSTAYAAGGSAPAVVVDPSLTISGSTSLTGAVVTIGSGFVSAEDRLYFTTQNGITGTYTTATGVLKLTGSGTTSDYQTALRSVTYGDIGSTPTAGTRVISISLGTAVSDPDNGHFYEYVTATLDWPSAQSAAAARTYLGLTGYLATITTPAENTFIAQKLAGDGWMGGHATAVSFPRHWYWAGGPEVNTNFCYNSSTGVCSTENGLYADWASGEPNNSSNNEACAQMYSTQSGTWNDLPCSGTTQPGYVVEYGGSASDPTNTISGTKNVQVSYTATTLATTASTLGYNAGDAATVVDPGVSVGGTSTFTSATVTLSTGFVSAQDTLAMPTTNGITASYNASTGVLTLSGTGVASDYQAALRAVTYANSVSPLPTTAARVVTFAVGGKTGGRNLQVKSYPTALITSSGASSPVTQSVTLTVTMNPLASTGTVQIFADGASLGTPTLASGKASVTTSSLALGTHAITASYSGDTQRNTASANVFTQTITTIPNGGGTCAPGNAATYCASGLCNTSTGTCGADVATSCTAANQCADNVCSNGQCGASNGGSCVSGSGCQSGVCSTNADQCIPSGGKGCAVQADCAAGSTCNTGTYTCETDYDIETSSGTTSYSAANPAPAPVVVDPQLSVIGDEPLAGATVTIGTGFVASQDALHFTSQNGITGSYDSTHGILTLSGTASTAQYQAAMRSVTYSNSAGIYPSTALRTVTFGLGSAVANSANGHFYEFVSYTATWSNAQTSAAARTYLGLHGYLATVTSVAENQFITGKLTSDGWVGGQANPQNSFPRTWSWVTGPEAGQEICANPSSGVCPSYQGAYVNWNPQEPNNQGGEGCMQIYFAQAGRWNDLPCASGTLAGYVVEYGGLSNDPDLSLNASKTLQVTAAATMSLGSSLNPAQLNQAVTFTATVAPSAATGTVQFSIDGAAVGSPVSLSGGTATYTTSSLALGNHPVSAAYAGDSQNQAVTADLLGGQTVTSMSNGNGPCDSNGAATECTNGVCSPSASTCGFGNGEGPCTPGTDDVCQSGVCSKGDACMPSTTGGCYVDEDCDGGEFCDRTNFTCHPTLPTSAGIPNDGLHDGVCHGGTSDTCQTGLCNSTTNTCANDNGTPCSARSTCSSNSCSPSGYCVPTGNGGCYADSDCGNGTYCDRGALTCTAKLPPGTGIPSDGNHNGTCANDHTSPACSSGLCNTTTNTCASGNGNGCTMASECEYGTCNSSGTCGISDGNPGCSGTTAYLCESGKCSVSGSCVPSGPNGCYVDPDCSPTQFCDRTSLTCASKSDPGVRLPDDGVLHDGVCDSTLAQAACKSGACNAVTNTCAAANNQTCTAADQCVSNTCGSNGKCGTATGDGPCTVSGGAASCQSGVCNASASAAASACVPTSNSCYADDDCASGQFCARGTYTCTPKSGPGTGLPHDGLHDTCPGSGVSAACSTGFCNPVTNTCAAANDTVCSNANQCVTDVCGSNGDCGIANGDPGCTSANGAQLCQSGACTVSGHCAPGGGCYLDSDCGNAGQFCNRTTLTCQGKLLPGESLPNDGLHDGNCDAATVVVCQSGLCDAAGQTCAVDTGADCATDNQCENNICGANGKCGLANGEPGCSSATANLCQSGACSTDGFCIPHSAGSCWADVDCAAAQHCNRGSLTCVADGPAGSPIPNDGLHDGICDASTAQIVCATGLCNPAHNTCADGNGKGCTDATQCVEDVCGSNGQCGLADGQGECTNATADRCQSDTCSVSSTCMATAGCWVDADCGSGKFCHRDTQTCGPMAPAGTPIPSDGLHDGTCSTVNAEAVCVTGECNADTNTCASKNLTLCKAANQCMSNVCSNDGKCGQVDGSVCSSDSQCRGGCVDGKCAVSDSSKLNGGGGCSSSGSETVSVLALLAVALMLLARRNSGRTAAGLLAVAGLLTVQSAQAQSVTSMPSSGASIDTFRTAAPNSDWFEADSLDFRGQVRPSARLLVDWAHDPLVVYNADGSKRSTAVQNQLFFDVGAALTLFDRLRISANLPVAAYQNGHSTYVGGVQVAPASSGGLGDVAVAADVRVAGHYAGPAELALGVAMTTPSGKRANLLGDGRVSVMPRALAAGEVGLFVWSGQLGFNVRNAAIGTESFGNELRFGVSGGVKLAASKLVLGPELYALAPVGKSGNGDNRSFGLEGDVGAHYQVASDWKLGAGVGTGLARSAGIPDVRLLASLDFAPAVAAGPAQPLDSDGDGVPDAQDACPNQRGDFSARGCPDADHDGVPDSADQCPNQAAGGAGDANHLGCPAPADADADGFPDAIDQCPHQPAGPTPNAQRPGCPDGDADHDGVMDSADPCPNEAAGATPDAKRPGCPAVDADGDGVPDAQDACPNVKGAPSEDAKTNGCPGLVSVEGGQIHINAPIKFGKNSDALLDASKPVLEAVASALKAMPQIGRLSVEGYSDLKGKPARNQKLSERRAEAVKLWLTGHGVSADRLEAHGYGSNKPIVAVEKTDADRAANRRVEFTILK